MIDMNLRSLRRNNGGEYTLIPQTQESMVRNLCVKCGKSECWLRDSAPIIRAQQVIGANVEVNRCSGYMPPIGFQDTKGLIEGSNTLRLGSAWGNRVKKGDSVALVCVKTNLVIGAATVQMVRTGERDVMMRRHSSKNHLMIEKGIKGKRAVEAMVKLMPQIYGNLIWRNNNTITAIYLEQVTLYVTGE